MSTNSSFVKKCYFDSHQAKVDTEIISKQVAPNIENEILDLILPPSTDEDDSLLFYKELVDY